MKKLLVCGSRSFNDPDRLYAAMAEAMWELGDPDNVEIVSGGAKGADTMAIDYAITRNKPYRVFPANWEKYGNAAGFIRNAEMRVYCKDSDTIVLAAWDGKSRGTQHMLDIVNKDKNVKVKILKFDSDTKQ